MHLSSNGGWHFTDFFTVLTVLFAVSSVQRQIHRLRVTLINETYSAELEDRNSEEFMEMSRYVTNLVKTLMLILNTYTRRALNFWIQIIYLDRIRWLYFRDLPNEIKHKYRSSMPWLLRQSKQLILTIREVFGLHTYL